MCTENKYFLGTQVEFFGSPESDTFCVDCRFVDDALNIRQTCLYTHTSFIGDRCNEIHVP